MRKSSKRKTMIVIIVFLAVIASAIPVVNFLRSYHSWRGMLEYSPASFHQTWRDPLRIYTNRFENNKSVESTHFLLNLRHMSGVWLRALSSFSKDFDVIYEMLGLRSGSIHWPEFGDDSLLRYYSFLSYSGRVVHFFFDYENEIVPRAFYDIHGPRYIREFPSYDSELITWIGLMKKESNSSFALVDIFRTNEFYREFPWEQNKFIVEFDFIDSNYIKITYIDKTLISDLEKMMVAFSGYELFVSVNDWGVTTFRVYRRGFNSWDPSATPEDFEDYLSYEIIRLDSYINAESPIVDYRYEFINTGSVSGHVTKGNFDRLELFVMNLEDVNNTFQTEGLLVKQYSYNGNTFEIYGYLGSEAAVFAIFSEGVLIASEFLDPRFYRAR